MPQAHELVDLVFQTSLGKELKEEIQEMTASEKQRLQQIEDMEETTNMYGQFKSIEQKSKQRKQYESEQRIQGSVLKEILKSSSDKTQAEEDKVDLTYTNKVEKKETIVTKSIPKLRVSPEDSLL